MKKKCFSIILTLFFLPMILFSSGCTVKLKKNELDIKDDDIYEISQDGKYIFFGMYPQTIKENSVTVEETAGADGLYLGSDGEKYYKKTYFYDSRTGIDANSWVNYGFSTMSNGIVLQETQDYYFKMEKLKWRILSKNSDSCLIVCDSIISGVSYQLNYNGNYAVDGEGNYLLEDDGETKVYANNYKFSEVRRMLNDDFYNLAFSTEEKAVINLTEVDNSVASVVNASSNYTCENTNDYVFLLSYQDVINESYGFSSVAEEQDLAKRWYTTDFAKATHAISYSNRYLALRGIAEGSSAYDYYKDYIDTGAMWLRSPYNIVYNVYGIGVGCSDGYGQVIRPVYGVAPALNIKL